MGIKQDLEEAKELWKDSSLITKCVIIISLALTTSSVTSLSDVVFKWKGFILDGVNAYRSLISEPIINVLDTIGIYLSFANIDLLVLYGIFISGSIRGYFGNVGEEGVLGEKLSEKLSKIPPKVHLFVYIVFFSMGALFAFLFCRLFGSFNGLLLSIIGCAIFAALLAKGIFYNYVGPILFAIVVVLFLGAINAGLTRN